MTYLLEPEIPTSRLPPRRCAARRAHGAADQGWRDDLRGIVAQRIVPHLLAHPGRSEATAHSISPDQIAAFASLVVSPASPDAAGVVDDVLAGGATLESVFTNLFAPTARRLGDLWLADSLSFLDVTRGMLVLQSLLRLFGPAFERDASIAAHGGSIFLMPVPGEQHVFGLSMLAAFFRRAGWRVVYEPSIDAVGAAARLANEPFDVLGVSAAGSRFVARLPDLLTRLRGAAANPGLSVLVGGPAFVGGAIGAADVGANAVVEDAPSALKRAAAAVAAQMPIGRAATA